MKLFQYLCPDGAVRTGALRDGIPYSLKKALPMEALLGMDDAAIGAMLAEPMAKDSIVFAPALSNPGKIICIGLNYTEHIRESRMEDAVRPGFPPIFPKFRSSLLAHGAPLHLPASASQFDYEAELVVVMGSTCKSVTPAQAQSCIAGYTVGNDFSARDLQFVTGQWTLGKACDEFAPLGPYFTPRDEVDVDHLAISCRVNGELVQQASTAQMIYSCTEIVSYLSQYMTLEKGDLIFTGTPSGVILGRPEEQRTWLKSGDTVTVEIESLGKLENTLI